MAADPRGKILVVDDEADARAAVAELLEHEGFAVTSAGDAFKALGKLAEAAPEVVLTDLRMPGMDGLELMHRVRVGAAPPEVVVLSGVDEVATAVRAMREGAADYLVKPVDPDELVVVIDKQVAAHRRAVELARLRARLDERRAHVHAMVGDTPAMREVYEAIARVAPSRATVLITGESGTGKELVAEAIHAASPRADGPFVKVHCAALAEGLLESELFGHERGAFTGAVARRDGRFVAADRGTLFLDEIGEIPPSVQVKLLRVLQEREIDPVGGDHPVKVDVRVIAATHRDLAAMVKAGTFREDLYYRLDVVAIEVPPLRVRAADVPPLARHFFDQSTRANGRALEGFAAPALAALVAYPWPGNVRELEHAIERAVVMTGGPLIELGDLPPAVRGAAAPDADAISIPGSSLHAIERHVILKTMEATGGSTARAAAILEVTPRTIQYRLQEYRRAPKGMGPPLATPPDRDDADDTDAADDDTARAGAPGTDEVAAPAAGASPPAAAAPPIPALAARKGG